MAQAKPMLSFLRSASLKQSTYNAGDARDSGSIMGQGEPLEEEMMAQSSILAWKILDKGAWWAIVHRVPKNQTQWAQHTQTSEVSIVGYSELWGRE